jgi:hypothetical protein
MQEPIKKGNKLIELITDNLSDEEKNIVQLLDFEKTDEEIIQELITGNIVNFEDSQSEDKENQ